jgi:hypothetical protein
MKTPKSVFLLGAGGMGMAPLALYLQGAGIQVSAHDENFREPLRSQLSESGIEVLGEPIPAQIPDCIIRSRKNPPFLRIGKNTKFPSIDAVILLLASQVEKKFWPLLVAMGKPRLPEC